MSFSPLNYSSAWILTWLLILLEQLNYIPRVLVHKVIPALLHVSWTYFNLFIRGHCDGYL